MIGSPSDLSSRVKYVIERSGMSQATFAEGIGLDAPKLSKSLGGTRRFTSLELALIADVGDTTVDWLLNGDRHGVPAIAARVQQDAEPGVAVAAQGYAASYDDIYATLTLAGSTRTVKPLPTGDPTGTRVSQGERLAEAALEQVRSSGFEKLMLEDLEAAVEESFSIDVGRVDLKVGFDGLSLCHGDFRLALVNNQTSWSRQRFTLAHEVGHILAGDSQQLRLDANVMSPTQRRAPSEMRANSFAAAFLMPADRLRDACIEGVDEQRFAELIAELRVSPSALSWRLFNLRLIGPEQQISFSKCSIKEAAMRANWVKEYRDLTRQQGSHRPPQLLLTQAFVAQAEGLISVRPLAAILEVPEDALLPSPVIPPRPGEPPHEEPVFEP